MSPEDSERMNRAEGLATEVETILVALGQVNQNQEAVRAEADRLMVVFNVHLTALRVVLADLKAELNGIAEELAQ